MSEAVTLCLRSRSTGQALDATVSAEPAGHGYCVFLESRSGSRLSARARNPDYAEALEELLYGFGSLHGSIQLIEIVSRPAMKLPANERVLAFEYPINLDRQTNFHQLRVLITEAQRHTARTNPKRHQQGGNNNKRICLFMTFEHYIKNINDLAAALASSGCTDTGSAP